MNDIIAELKSIAKLYSDGDLTDDLEEVLVRIGDVLEAIRALPTHLIMNTSDQILWRIASNIEVCVKFVEIEPVMVQGYLAGAVMELLMLRGDS